ncbi:MAG: hypothetical protein KBE65_02725 [Phycisphaerae bacterium]|nr:hypothetical protein [Phycisphaerae bacterium]
MRVVVERYEAVVVERLPVGWIVTCAMCGGRGIKPGYNETSCPSCGGTGKRKLLIPEDADRTLDWGPVFCGFCQGSGIKPGYNETQCLFATGEEFRQEDSLALSAESAVGAGSSLDTMRHPAMGTVAMVVGPSTLTISADPCYPGILIISG